MHDVLEVEGVCYRYGARPALDGVDLGVPAGACVALLGANGAGKTTLVGLVTGLLAPSSGRVAVAGGDPRRAVTRRSLGVAAQSAGFPRTARVGELLASAATRAGAPRGAAERALAAVGVGDLARRRAGALSGGQQRRVQLAMALVGEPAVLVLDEPTAGLDVVARREFWSLVADRRDTGAGVLLTTHLMEEAAAVADHVVVLDGGRVVAAGTPADLTAAMPLKTVSALSSLADDDLALLPGAAAVRRERDRTVVSTSCAEEAVARWLAADPLLRDLRVEASTLEQAVVSLSGGGAGTGAVTSAVTGARESVGARS